jgi:hypothetical protein
MMDNDPVILPAGYGFPEMQFPQTVVGQGNRREHSYGCQARHVLHAGPYKDAEIRVGWIWEDSAERKNIHEAGAIPEPL